MPYDCEFCQNKLRELEFRLVGIDGHNGLTSRVQALEKEMNQSIKELSEKLDTINENNNDRLRNLEIRVYLICGVPAIVGGTIAALKFLHLIN